MLKKFLYVSMVVAMSVVSTSCGGNDNDDDPDYDPTPTPSGTMDKMTPAESKVFLDDTAVNFLNKFKASDQQELLELSSWAIEEYGDLDMPENFEIEPDGNPSRFLSNVAAAMAKGDASRAAKAATVYTYTLNFGLFSGIYEPVNGQWVKTGTSSDIIFRFNNKSGKTCEVKAVAAGGSYDVNFDINDWDWDYNPSTGMYEDYEYTDTYKVTVPKQVTLTVTNNGTEMLNAVVNSEINFNSHTFSVTADVTAANLVAYAQATGTDTKINQSSTFAVSGETLIVNSATLNGSKLCDRDNWESLADDDDLTSSNLATILNSGTATATLLNKVSVDANVTFNDKLFDVIETSYWDWWDYDDNQSQAKADAEAAAQVLNNNVKAVVRYNNTTTEQATIVWKPYFDQWGSNRWEYYLEALLLFPDDTTYSFEDYFESGFGNLETLWDNLLDSYERIWKNARR